MSLPPRASACAIGNTRRGARAAAASTKWGCRSTTIPAKTVNACPSRGDGLNDGSFLSRDYERLISQNKMFLYNIDETVLALYVQGSRTSKSAKGICSSNMIIAADECVRACVKVAMSGWA